MSDFAVKVIVVVPIVAEMVDTLGIDRFGDRGTSTRLGLSTRDLDVLRLLAEGHDTAEIAQQMAYSESLIKHVIQRLITRFHVRNRTHLVAMAIRAGLI